MVKPCHNDVPVGILRENFPKVERAIGEISESLKVTNSLLTTLAEQGAEIKHLREDTLRNEKDIDGLFGRVRILEMSPGRAASKIFLVGLAAAGGCIGSAISGVVVILITQR
jgi:hypothetical protein